VTTLWHLDDSDNKSTQIIAVICSVNYKYV